MLLLLVPSEKHWVFLQYGSFFGLMKFSAELLEPNNFNVRGPSDDISRSSEKSVLESFGKCPPVSSTS